MSRSAATLRGNFRDDPSLSARVFELLDAIFPGIRDHASRARSLGFAWEEVSTPFLLFDEGKLVSHVSVLELPAVVMGERVTVGVIHGVGTHPGFRRRGYFRRVMEQALEYCEGRYATLQLCTAQPQLYERFGFRVVAEHAFAAPVIRREGTSSRLRELELDDPIDLQRLRRLLVSRQPVSMACGVTDQAVVFMFNELERRLHYASDLDQIVSLEIEGTTLKLFDLVATTPSRLDEILQRIDRPLDRVELYFSPDRLEVDARPYPYTLTDGDQALGGAGASILMIRGPFAAEGRPFMLPRPARC